VIVLGFAPVAAQAQEGRPVTRTASPYEVQASVEYWTPERMAAARPMPLPMVVDPQLPRPEVLLPPDARPGFAPGWDPRSGLAPPHPLTRYELNEEQWKNFTNFPGYLGFVIEPMAFGSPPANPVDYPNYGKFARWTWYGNYLVYPTSTIGKLFFTIPGVGDGACTATVIGRSTIVTAGHCVSSLINGTPTWHTNFLFCPSYYRAGGSGGPHPARGCWSWVRVVTTFQWHYFKNLDLDYACIVTHTTGTVVADKVGNVTGWVGRTWNWPPVQSILAWGYPGEPPFPGYHIITVAANEWYSVNTSDEGESVVNLVSKYIGSDMTGGSSGGPWWLGTRHPNPAFNYADTDGVLYTGWVGGPFLNGVNSHRRCFNYSCARPPSASGGVFWQEMGSPPFTSSSTDYNDSEDVFGNCLSHSNNNP